MVTYGQFLRRHFQDYTDRLNRCNLIHIDYFRYLCFCHKLSCLYGSSFEVKRCLSVTGLHFPPEPEQSWPLALGNWLSGPDSGFVLSISVGHEQYEHTNHANPLINNQPVNFIQPPSKSIVLVRIRPSVSNLLFLVVLESFDFMFQFSLHYRWWDSSKTLPTSWGSSSAARRTRATGCPAIPSPTSSPGGW